MIGKAASQQSVFYAQFQVPLPECNLLSLFSIREQLSEKSFYWKVPSEQFEFLAGGTLAEFRGNGPDRFSDANRAHHEWLNRRRILGSGEDTKTIPYCLLGGAFFDSIADAAWKQFAPLLLYIPKWLVIKKGGHCRAVVNMEITGTSNPLALEQQLVQRVSMLENGTIEPLSKSGGYSITVNGQQKSWMNMVASSIRAIREHALDKVVVGAATQIDLTGTVNVAAMLSDLAENYPSCVTFALREASGHTFFGSSPEWLLRIDGDHISCGALAGSSTRSENPQEDRRLGTELLQNQKNLDEHAYVVRYLTDQVSGIASEVSVQAHPQLQKLKNVQHLYTPVRGRLNTAFTPLQILERFHPTPAVGGIPTPKALQLIRELEEYDRGYFAGPIGWLGQHRDMDIAVGLRSALLHDQKVYVYAGAGIVKDSDPSDEYEERRLKLQPILSALQNSTHHG